MNITIINKYYAPDASATSQLLTDLATHLAQQGNEVTVVTSRQLYLDPKANLASSQTSDGVKVVRLWASSFGRGSILGRAIDSLWFYLGVFLYLLFSLRKNNLVICCTDPPFISVPVALACLLKRARLVNWLQDLYPEVAVNLGVIANDGWPNRLLKSMRNWSLRRARRNVVLGECMADYLSQFVDTQTVTVIHNWSDNQAIRPLPAEHNPLRRSWRLDGKFVIGYSGNFGQAHDYKTILNAAIELQNIQNRHNSEHSSGIGTFDVFRDRHSLISGAGMQPEGSQLSSSEGQALGAGTGTLETSQEDGNLSRDRHASRHTVSNQGDRHASRHLSRGGQDICFVIIGDGFHRKALQGRVQQLQLRNVFFYDYQPRDQLGVSLTVADVHLILLKPQLEGFIVPSKFYGVAASGRPMIFIGDKQGEIARILARNNAGVTVPEGDSSQLVAAILQCRADDGNYQQMAENSRRMADDTYNMPISLSQWEQLLQKAGSR